MPSLNAAVQWYNVTFSVKGKTIIQNLTGTFYEGKITTLVGPSGAGKSTLFKLCNGLHSADTGDILIAGKEIASYPPVELRRMVGFALQDATMIDGTVYENLAMPLTLQGKDLSEEKAQELLQLVGLPITISNQSTNDLSGGQRQKLSIARTLVNRPSILLLDEITSSLDRVSQQDIEALIVRINKNYGTTIVWITHNLQQARTIGDYTWVLINGQLIESGESSLLDNPENHEVRLFLKGDHS
ncbi:osmoprotectant uptake system ATP-binding protein YehX [Oceanobacillus picturae]|uniref:Osmoprotectant uptake system ATP-binding protein YehX n=1 Tax=Oceanobacillus picturae TaxID=171693 RepID=A0A0U9HA30_9BACI|nr:phosphate ABC transporter ATP-binding protein [Oceanobacillus picturae]GAQ19523.1 osmoprotectant uptake system ATP-binding protein YehX [Oceanobacillus picturae]